MICHIAILKLSQFIWIGPEVLVPVMRKMQSDILREVESFDVTSICL